MSKLQSASGATHTIRKRRYNTCVRLCIATTVLLLTCSATALSQCEQRIDGPPNFKVRTVQIEGLESLPRAEAASLRKSIEQLCFSNANELGERTRDVLQQYGYFKAAVEQPKLVVKEDSRWPAPADVVLAVAPGVQYRLHEITFSGNKTLNNNASLRALFPIADGEVLDIAKLRTGIRRMKDAYGEYGFVNFLPIPDFTFDEQQKLATMKIDVDEGQQFIVEEAEILAPHRLAKQLVECWYLKVGDVYNARLVNDYFSRNRRLLPKRATAERSAALNWDSQKATVRFRLNLCDSDEDCISAFVPCSPSVTCNTGQDGIPHMMNDRKETIHLRSTKR